MPNLPRDEAMSRQEIIDQIEAGRKELGISPEAMKKGLKYIKDLRNLSAEERKSEEDFYWQCARDAICSELDPELLEEPKWKDSYD